MTLLPLLERELGYSLRIPLTFELYHDFIDEFPPGGEIDEADLAALMTPPVRQLDEDAWLCESPKRVIHPSAFAPIAAWVAQHGFAIELIDLSARIIYLTRAEAA